MATPIHSKDNKLVREAADRLNNLIKDAKTLQTAETIIGGIERVVLNSIVEAYDTASAIRATREFNQAIRENQLAHITQCRSRLEDELFLWRMVIVKRDDRIFPQHLRQFCELAELSLDKESLTALMRFYMSRPHTTHSQNKYDFVITRLFAIDQNKERSLSIDQSNLAKMLSEVSCLTNSVDINHLDETKLTSILETFDQFLSELRELKSFSDLIACELFNRIRLFKNSLGGNFYIPDISAAAIKLNVMVANKVSLLIKMEKENIRKMPGIDQELAEILGPITFSSKEDSIDKRRELKIEKAPTSTYKTQPLSTESNISKVQDVKEQSDNLKEKEVSNISNRETIDDAQPLFEVLSELMKPTVNVDMILNYLKVSPSSTVRNLDPNAFFLDKAAEESGINNQELQIRLKALGHILRTDYLLRSDWEKKRIPHSQIEASLKAMLDDIHTSNSSLQTLIDSVPMDKQAPKKVDISYIVGQLNTVQHNLESLISSFSVKSLSN
jgi:hypothetical protein